MRSLLRWGHPIRTQVGLLWDPDWSAGLWANWPMVYVSWEMEEPCAEAYSQSRGSWGTRLRWVTGLEPQRGSEFYNWSVSPKIHETPGCTATRSWNPCVSTGEERFSCFRGEQSPVTAPGTPWRRILSVASTPTHSPREGLWGEMGAAPAAGGPCGRSSPEQPSIVAGSRNFCGHLEPEPEPEKRGLHMVVQMTIAKRPSSNSPKLRNICEAV